MHPYGRIFEVPGIPDENTDETIGYETGDTIHVISGGAYLCRDAGAGVAIWLPIPQLDPDIADGLALFYDQDDGMIKGFTPTKSLAFSSTDGEIVLYSGTGGKELTGSGRTMATLREKLTANRTYYVRTDGSDSNTGLVNNAGGAFLTIQKAVDAFLALDNGGYNVTIQIADGTYTAGAVIKGWLGTGALTIQGNSGTPSNVWVNVTGGNCFLITGALPSSVTIKDMKLQCTTSGTGIWMEAAGSAFYGNINFAACASYHIYCEKGRIQPVSNYTISGGGVCHWVSNAHGYIVDGPFTVTVSGTPAFTFFAYATRLSNIVSGNITWSGSATGTRYTVDGNSVILVPGKTTSYFPGDALTVPTTGGQYIT